MKKILSAIMIGLFVFTALPMDFAYAEEAYQENVLDKMSDWAATVGKDKVERDRILATRKADRQRKHAEKKAAQMKKRAEKKAGKMKKEAEAKKKNMKKKMGL